MTRQKKETSTGVLGTVSGFALGKTAKDVSALLHAVKSLAQGCSAKAFEFLKECGVAKTLQAAFTNTMPFSIYGAPQVAQTAPNHAATHHQTLAPGGGGSARSRRQSQTET